MTLKRMDNVLIVVDDLEAVKAFFIELGLKLEGETTVEGPSVGSLIGLKDVRATLAMMRTRNDIFIGQVLVMREATYGPEDQYPRIRASAVDRGQLWQWW